MTEQASLLPCFASSRGLPVEHWIGGVFEGGRAKGIVYLGALGALEERTIWFRATASASVGAIAASLHERVFGIVSGYQLPLLALAAD